MSNNVGGSYATTTANVFKAFDSLPLEIRRALNNALEDWVPQPVATAFEKRGKSRRECVKMIRKWDRLELAKREDQRLRGIGPYKGFLPDPDYKPKRRKQK